MRTEHFEVVALQPGQWLPEGADHPHPEDRVMFHLVPRSEEARELLHGDINHQLQGKGTLNGEPHLSILLGHERAQYAYRLGVGPSRHAVQRRLDAITTWVELSIQNQEEDPCC